MKNRERAISVWIAGVVFALSLGGCFYGRERYVAGEPFNGQALRGMEQGELARSDVLRWFGPPVAIARRGTTMTFPPPRVRPAGWIDIRSDTFFELFPRIKGNAEDRIIYYYHAPRLTMNGYFSIFIAGGYTRRTTADELWILINERTGRIEDYVLRTAEKEAVGTAAGGPPAFPGSGQ